MPSPPPALDARYGQVGSGTDIAALSPRPAGLLWRWLGQVTLDGFDLGDQRACHAGSVVDFDDR